jgi:SAM-dependent methyltransferase
MSALKRVRRAVRVHGPSGAVKAGARSARTWRDRRHVLAYERTWDLAHGVDTAGVIPLTELAIDSAHRDLGIRYQGSSPDGFRRLIRKLPLPPAELTFIDLGAGKGRALLLASEFPFTRVVGVEFAPKLADIARANISNFTSERRKCDDVVVVCGDAVEYELPNEPAVVYIYNAFERPVMEKVLAGLKRSKAQHPRPLLLALTNRNIELEALRRAGFRRVVTDDHGEIFAAT